MSVQVENSYGIDEWKNFLLPNWIEFLRCPSVLFFGGGSEDFNREIRRKVYGGGRKCNIVQLYIRRVSWYHKENEKIFDSFYVWKVSLCFRNGLLSRVFIASAHNSRMELLQTNILFLLFFRTVSWKRHERETPQYYWNGTFHLYFFIFRLFVSLRLT